MLLLFDSGKKLEKAVGEEAAQVIFETFEKFGEEQGRELATKGDILALRADLYEEIQSVRTELRDVRTELREDIQSVRTELRDVRTELREDIQSVRSELREDIQSVRSELHKVRTELREDIQSVRSELRETAMRITAEFKGEISASKHEILKWVMGMLIAQTGILVALYAVIK